MNNEIDLLDELEREERDERLATGGGGAGAALGVVLTLLIGCGLVFAAYKLGQRKTVDEPPLIAANESPIKIAPENPGGAAIPNTGNFANAMIDGSRPATSGDALRDGVVAEAGLPARDIDQAATSADAREIMREVTQLNDIEMKPSLEGEPVLVAEGAPDRSAERMMVSGAEVPPAARPSLDELVASAVAEDEQIDNVIAEGGALPPRAPALALEQQVGTGTSIASASFDATEEQVASLTMRMPTRKPNLSTASMARQVTQDTQRTPALAPDTRNAPDRVRQPLEPAIARISPTPPAPNRQNQLAQPVPQVPGPSAIQRVRIAPQPVGDAQVQLGAFPSPDEVRGRWSAIKGRNPDLLGPLGLKVLPVQTADGRQLFRMRVGPLRDTRQAAQLCQALEGRGIDCFVPARR